jgi:hypothetical protein
MTKFADTHTRLSDDVRVREIRDFEAAKVERQFAPIAKRARANRDALLAPRRGFAFAIA